MDHIESFARTYSQSPWRKQLQIIVLFLLGVVFVALIAAIYLNVSARATAAGREIQQMQREITTFKRDTEDLQSQLARILSFSQMEARARNLGFVAVIPDQILYLNVPGYIERQPAILAPAADAPAPSAISIPPEYTESLFEWLTREFWKIYSSLMEKNP